MKTKWIIATILILALFVTCAASGLALWQGLQWMQSLGFDVNSGGFTTFEVNATDEQVLQATGPLLLTVENNGSVRIEAGSADEVQITAQKTAWGKTAEGAQQTLEDLRVVAEQKGNEIHVSVDRIKETDLLDLVPRGGRADLVISVPPETSVRVSSDNGNLELYGTQGNAVLEVGYGEIWVKDLTGGLSASTSNGKIIVQNVEAGSETVTLSSTYNDIEVHTLSARNVVISMENGDLRLSEVKATGKLDIRSDYGELILRSTQAQQLEAHTSNGKVEIWESYFSERANISSLYGDLKLDQVQAAESDLKTQNGQITVSRATGHINAHSDYGNVDINAEQAILSLSSDNGKILFSGSLADGQHNLRTQYGDVRVSLPADTALAFDFQTDYGKIQSDFPMAFRDGLSNEEKHWLGNINGQGSSRLTISTSNGDIILQILK